ncbi:ATP-binding protein [Mycobacterium avium]|uniref:ATP-binding protein n=1 Tax=Mycobacterium avium TaxID=1764 RepID=UPI0004472D72|nr:ATP-binding protein [Mycobacterium avium]ETZ44681.1 AAA ATPase domain protein [Mycobacterium avium MAV_061107_1842]
MIGGELLIGRDSELAAIRRALNGADHHRGVVIAGAAGVGKTWLARAALRRAGASGEQIKWIVGTQSARPCARAFIGLLGDAMSERSPACGG